MKLRYLFSLLLSLISFTSYAESPSEINWQKWGLSPFQQAKSEDKMIILDVGIEGCTACRWMDEGTYTHPQVIKLINENFIAIVADAESQPDVGERYSDWAWPATIFMASNAAQILALSGNRRPNNFIPILEELIDKKSKGELEADELAPYAAPPIPEETELTKLRDRIRNQLDTNLNNEYGGWGRNSLSTLSGSRVQHLYFRAHLYNHDELQKLAIKTTNAYLKAIDPVWGGVFVVAFHEGENIPPRFKRLGTVPEKRISNQANAISVFSTAYQITRKKIYLNAIANIDKFLHEWMMAKDGTFYTSQEDDPPKLTSGMNAIDYWLLTSDSDRRQYGIPPFDHAVYTDKNGQVITAYIDAYEATGNNNYLVTAIKAAQSLVDKRMQPESWVKQSKTTAILNKDNRMRPHATEDTPLLSAQAWFGTALLALYRASGDEKWLNYAKDIAEQMLVYLYDSDNGGFFASVAKDTSAIIPRRKPLEHNATAAHFFYDLWVYSKNEKIASIPENTLRAVAVPEITRREGKITGQTALALEKLTAAYVEFSVVGDPEDPQAQALYTAGLESYHPRKLLHYEKAGRYPVRDKPAMYICNPDRCSFPIEDPTMVARQADSFRKPATTSSLFVN